MPNGKEGESNLIEFIQLFGFLQLFNIYFILRPSAYKRSKEVFPCDKNILSNMSKMKATLNREPGRVPPNSAYPYISLKFNRRPHANLRSRW